MKRYKSTTILEGTPSGKIVQCQSFNFIFKKTYDLKIFILFSNFYFFRFFIYNLLCVVETLLKHINKFKSCFSLNTDDYFSYLKYYKAKLNITCFILNQPIL